MIRMDDIRKFTNDSLQMDYFTWYLEQCKLDAEIFNNAELRAEQKFKMASVSQAKGSLTVSHVFGISLLLSNKSYAL